MSPQSPLEPNDERGRGILTKDDRAFLRGNKEFKNEQSVRDARYRIRERVKNSILDFKILLHHLDEKDRNQIFTTNVHTKDQQSKESIAVEEIQKMVNQSRFQTSMSDAVAFLYLGAMSIDWHTEDFLASGVETAEEERGYMIENVEVSVRVSRSEPDIQELLDRLEQGEGMTAEELRTLIRSGEVEISPETLDTIFKHISTNLPEGEDEGDIQ